MYKKVTVEGEMLVHSKMGKGYDLDFYQEEFILENVESLSEARMIVKKGLLNDRLRKKHKGYKRFRTHEVTEFENTDQKPENENFSRLLVRAAKENCIPESLDNYASEDSKAKAIEKSIKNKELSVKKKKKQDDESLTDID